MNNTNYEFTADWFSYYIPIWSHILDALRPSKILEIGSYEGKSTCYLIEECSKIHSTQIYCIDTWQGGLEHDRSMMSAVEQRFDKNISIAQNNAKNSVSIRKMKNFSALALADLIVEIGTNVFDLIYIDGSHQATDVLTDAVFAFQLLKVGGVMIFDDYLWNMEQEGMQDPFNMPKPGIDAFTNVFQRKVSIMSKMPLYQLYLRKVSD